MIGIYRITSPSGKVYIGQSINIKGRWSSHRRESTWYSLGNSRKGVKCEKSSKVQKGRVCVNNGQQTKRIVKEKLNEYLANGWKRGYHYKINYAARNLPNNTGKVCIWKGKEERRINKIELESYEKNEWRRGHNPKYKGKRS